jgi:hypothetical protein
MDHYLVQAELDRAKSWLSGDRRLSTVQTQLHLETLKDTMVELQSELDRQSRNLLGRNILSAVTGARYLKEKLRELQQVNNVMDSLSLSMLSTRFKDSEVTLSRLEEKIDTLVQRMDQQFETHDGRFGQEIDSGTSDSPWQESDEDNILQKLSALSIKGLDILADVLECEDYFELSNRLRVWGLGVMDGPFAIETLKAMLDGRKGIPPSIQYPYFPLKETFDIFTAPFIRILFNIGQF